MNIVIEEKRDALQAIAQRGMYTGMTKRQVVEAVLNKARAEGWIDVIVQCQRAHSRDTQAATKGR